MCLREFFKFTFIAENITDDPVPPSLGLLRPSLRAALFVFSGRQLCETEEKRFVFEGIDSTQSYTCNVV